MTTITLGDDWGRQATVRTATFLEEQRGGELKGIQIGETADGLLFRLVAVARLYRKPFVEIWESEDGCTWGRRL